jgi:hypothetical protein
MALARWQDLCIDADDAAALAAFWAPALGLEAAAHSRRGVVRLAGDTAERTVWVNTVPEPRSAKNRVHVDLVADSVQPYVALGAQVLHEPTPGWPWHLLADPEGNQWCVFAPKPGEPSALVTDAADEEAIAAWWADVLGARLSPGPEGRLRWLRDVDGLPWDVWKFVQVPEPKTVKNRWHWDVVGDDVDALLAKGATLLRSPTDADPWHVLADPEGNEFCVFGSR